MLRATVLLEELETLFSPRVVRWNAEALPDYAIHLRPEENLVHRELLTGAQSGGRFVANLQNGGARHRLFVILDLVLYVKLVLVLERARTVLGHGVGQGTRAEPGV
jgi:hypothetical protein